jgi:magnesium transporter
VTDPRTTGVDERPETPEDDTREGRIVEPGADPSPEDERVAELLAHSIDVPVLAEAVGQQEAADAADTLEYLEDEEAADVLEAMDDHAAADALAEMQPPLAAGVIIDWLDEGRSDYAAELVTLMAPDDGADLLQLLTPAQREAVLTHVPVESAVELRRLAAYGKETAAGMMTTDFVALTESLTVADATELLRASALPDEIHDLPVVDATGRFVGIVSLRTLLLRPAIVRVGDFVDRSVRHIRADLDREDVAREFDRYDYFMLPVVDADDRLLGLVTVDDVIDIIREEQTEDVQKTVGAGKTEAVYSSVLEKFRGRFRWLFVSVLIMIPSAIVVSQFEGLIGELAILAVLMPVVAALAGNAGHQALAVTLRGIVLDEVRPDLVWPLIRREMAVGLLSGMVLGTAVGLAIMAMSPLASGAGWQLGVVVAVSMTVSMCAGALAGSLTPLIMHRFGADPAQSSAIFLIMVTDAVAFLTFLGLAALSSQWLRAGVEAAGA